MRRAGAPDRPALWLVHALGDSSRSFAPLFATALADHFELLAPDWHDQPAGDLDALAGWLAREIESHTPARPIGLVGHSLGAAVAVRVARRLEWVTGLFSIEGNLTGADAYWSGLATGFESAGAYRDHLRTLVRARAESAPTAQAQALWSYHASLGRARPETLWTIGRSAAARRGDALGEEYRSLTIPTLYFWSPSHTPAETHDYVARHDLAQATFAGGHWPMLERPVETAERIGAFFRPLFAACEPGGRRPIRLRPGP